MARLLARRFLAAALAFGLATGVAQAQGCGGKPPTDSVQGGALCLGARTFINSAGLEPRPALVVILHGDVSSGGPATYHYDLARRLGPGRRDLVVVALLRPGYGDAEGRLSEGSHNDRRDHYTVANIDAVADAIKRLKALYAPGRAVGVGHSGGAAFVGVIAGRHPGLLDAAVLVSCPCDIPTWRRMGTGNAWPNSLSAADFVTGVPPATRVVAITGAEDRNTSPVLAKDYVGKLAARGVPAEFVEVPREAHDFTGELRNATVRAVQRFARP